MANEIPRGIQPVEWKRKDGTKGIRYRVRIKRKDFNFDGLFEELPVAIEALTNSKTQLGRTALKDFLMAEEDKQELFGRSTDTNLRACLFDFYTNHYQRPENNPIDKKNNAIYLNIINVLSETLIQDKKLFEGMPPVIKAQMKYPPTKALGDFDPKNIESRDIQSYIKERIETPKYSSYKKDTESVKYPEPRKTGMISKATIVKELSVLSSFFSNYHSYAGEEFESLSLNNPVKKTSKKALRGATVKRERRLEEFEEQKIFDAFQRCRNKDMLNIFQLAICSGMRRSEILFLEWKQIDFKKEIITLTRTKNGDPIKIQMLPAAWEYLKRVERKPNTDRLFLYTQDGFKSNFNRVMGWAGVSGYRFHDLRSEFISRGLQLGLSKFVVTAMLAIKNQSSFDRTHLHQFEENERLSRPVMDIQKQVNHRGAGMTNHYFRLNLLEAMKDPNIDK